MISLDHILKDFHHFASPKAEKINNFLQDNLSAYRYHHTLSTVKFAMQLGYRENFDNTLIDMLLIAALGHDITKEKSPEFHRSLFSKYNRTDFIALPEAIFHSKSAPYFINEKFNIDDPAIFHAIFYHSTGCENMPLFSRIIFCADYLASQEHWSENEDKSITDEKISETMLTNLCIQKVCYSITCLISKKLPVQPESLNFYNKLISENSFNSYGK